MTTKELACTRQILFWTLPKLDQSLNKPTRARTVDTPAIKSFIFNNNGIAILKKPQKAIVYAIR